MPDIFTDEIIEFTPNAGVKIEAVHHEGGRIRLLEQATPTNPPAGEIWIYPKDDGSVYYKLSDGTEKRISTSVGAADKSAFQRSDYNANLGKFRVRSIASSGSHRFTFIIPDDFVSLVSLHLIGVPASGAAQANRDIDIASDYGGTDELYFTHSESDTSVVYDLSGATDIIKHLDISSVFTNISAGDSCGILVDHNSIGGTMNYIGIEVEYN